MPARPRAARRRNGFKRFSPTSSPCRARCASAGASISPPAAGNWRRRPTEASIRGLRSTSGQLFFLAVDPGQRLLRLLDERGGEGPHFAAGRGQAKSVGAGAQREPGERRGLGTGGQLGG